MMKFLILKIQNSNLKIVNYGKFDYFCYFCFIIHFLLKMIMIMILIEIELNDGYYFFINAFIKELKEICNKRNNEENIDIVCVKLLIKIIKNIYLDSIESNN